MVKALGNYQNLTADRIFTILFSAVASVFADVCKVDVPMAAMVHSTQNVTSVNKRHELA